MGLGTAGGPTVSCCKVGCAYSSERKLLHNIEPDPLVTPSHNCDTLGGSLPPLVCPALAGISAGHAFALQASEPRPQASHNLTAMAAKSKGAAAATSCGHQRCVSTAPTLRCPMHTLASSPAGRSSSAGTKKKRSPCSHGGAHATHHQTR